jgi:argininosuccinate synthase
MAKVILAYSGGLDTSVCIPWLKENKGLDVIAFSADLGQGEELSPLKEKAVKTGAEKCIILDLRKTFVEEFIWPAVRAGAHYGGYLLATALGRPLIGRELCRIAREEGATAIAHGCTGKGNDQVRLESVAAARAPDLKVIAPLREWEMKTREEEIEYAQKRGIPVPVTKKSPYSLDVNLWGVSIEAGVLEDPMVTPPDDCYQWTTSPEKAPDEPEVVELTFAGGVPVMLNGAHEGDPLALISALNEIAGRHGVGRYDLVEDRTVGIKSREIYEAPAGFVIDMAHKGLEGLTLSKDVRAMQRVLAPRYGELVYNGFWFSDLREALDGFFKSSQARVNGRVKVQLYKGGARVIGRESDQSLYNLALASYGEEDAFDHKAAEGFIKLWTLPLRAEARARGEA